MVEKVRINIANKLIDLINFETLKKMAVAIDMC